MDKNIIWYKGKDFIISELGKFEQISIKINSKIVKRCFDFSLEYIKSVHNKSIRSHGSQYHRPWWELIHNTTEGKLAEIATIALLNIIHCKENNIDTNINLLNFKFVFDEKIQTGKHNLDVNDVLGAEKRVDIKAIKNYAHWLTVNEYKDNEDLNMRSDIYILMRVKLLDCVGSTKIYENKPPLFERFDNHIECVFCGWAFIKDFFFDGENRFMPYFPYTENEKLIKSDSAVNIKLELDNNKNYEDYLTKYIRNKNWRDKNSLNVSLYSMKQFGLPINSLRQNAQDLYKALI